MPAAPKAEPWRVAYDAWRAKPDPVAMAAVVDALGNDLERELATRPEAHRPLLRQHGRIMMAKAVQSYDPERGAALPSWARTNLRELSRTEHKLRPVSVSQDVARMGAELNRVRGELGLELLRDPDDDELASASGMSVRTLRDLRAKMPPVVSDSQLAGDDPENTSAPGVLLPSAFASAAELVLNGLPEREQRILLAKTGFRGTPVKTNNELAAELKLSPAMISRISADLAARVNEVSRVL